MRKTLNIVMTVLGFLLVSSYAQAQESLQNVALEDGLLSGIQAALPESRNVDMEFLNPSYDPVIRLTDDAQIGLTFIDEGAGYRNSLGYFTFSDSSFVNTSFGDIDTNSNGIITVGELSNVGDVETGMIFNNASKRWAGGSLRAGDTAVLGNGNLTADGTDFTMDDGLVFESGTNVGFFLMQNAYSPSGVNENAMTMYSVDFLNPENDALATYDDVASNSRHVAMMFADYDQDELILGFEDLYRDHRSDEDFNDAVFRIRTDPIEAIQETNVTIMTAPAPHLGGGLAGMVALIFVFAFARKNQVKENAFA